MLSKLIKIDWIHFPLLEKNGYVQTSELKYFSKFENLFLQNHVKKI